MKKIWLIATILAALSACAKQLPSNLDPALTRAPTLTNEEFFRKMHVSPEKEAVKPRMVFVTTEPHSLILEDMARKMIADPALIVVEDKTSADVIVKIEAHNFVFNDEGAESRHVSFGKYQVPNLIGAAFYMPEASSYNIDIQHFRSAASYELAYTVSMSTKVEIGQKVIRGSIEREATQCSQPTINNAFGGVVPAQFWASGQLQAECANVGSRPTKGDLRSEVEDEIGRQMRVHLISLKVPEPPKKASKNKRKKPGS